MLSILFLFFFKNSIDELRYILLSWPQSPVCNMAIILTYLIELRQCFWSTWHTLKLYRHFCFLQTVFCTEMPVFEVMGYIPKWKCTFGKRGKNSFYSTEEEWNFQFGVWPNITVFFFVCYQTLPQFCIWLPKLSIVINNQWELCPQLPTCELDGSIIPHLPPVSAEYSCTIVN